MADERGDRAKKLFRERIDIDPYTAREKITVWTGLRFIWNIIKILLFAGIILGLILLIFLGLTGGFRSGFFQYYYETTSDFLSKAPILSPFIEVLKTVQDPSQTLRTYGWQSDVDKNSENKELGLKFQNFRSIKKVYLENEQISLVGTVNVNSLKDDSKVKFDCEASTSSIKGNIQPNEQVEIQKDSAQVFTIRCDIPEEEIKLDGKQVKAEIITLTADYDFKTESYVEAYTMSRELLAKKQNNQENPFEEENNPRLNKETGEIRSQYTAGPMKVLINSEYTQPFTEAGPFSSDPYYSLGILVEKANSFYEGKLNKINEVYLYLPKNFELSGEDDQFELLQENENEVFDKYRLKQDKIDQLNSYCKNANILDLQCQNYWDRGFIISLTKFRIAALNKEDLDKNYIRTEVDYQFQAKTSQTVTIAESLIP